MRKLALAGLPALLVAVVFAPAAVAKMHNDQMINDDDMMGSASASASAMSSATSSAMGDEMMSASASASSLPGTGGMPLLSLLPAAALIAGSGILAARLVRRNS